MGYITKGGSGSGGGGTDWTDDVVGIVVDETTIILPPTGVRYIPGSAGNAALKSILHTFVFDAAGYISCLPGDLGLVLTDGVGIGVLEGYVNATRTWLVSSMDSFLPGAAITIGGGVGAGTLTTDSLCGFQLLGNQTAFMAPNEVLHIRGGTNHGWYSIISVNVNLTVDTNVVVAQTVPYVAILASFAHWNIKGSEFALIGVDKIAQWDGVNWYTALQPTLGTTALFTSVNQFYTFGGNTWALFAATVDHSALINLGVDTHLQYLRLAGRAAGQSGYGGSLAATNLDLYANSVTAGTAHIGLSDTKLSIAALAATNIAMTVGIGAPITCYTTYSDVLTLHPTTTSTQDWGDATHIWQKLYAEEVGIYDTTGAEAASISRTLTDFNLTANSTGVANLNLTGTNITGTLGDIIGATSFTLYNSTPASIFAISSLGILTGLGLVSAYVGAADVGKVPKLDAAGMLAVGFIPVGSINHSSLGNLNTNDDHPRYAQLAGRAGGQILIGDTVAGGELELKGDAFGNGSIALNADVIVPLSKTVQYSSAAPYTNVGYTNVNQVSLTTHDGTPTDIGTIGIADQHAAHVDVIVVGMKHGGTQRALYHLSALCYRAGGGAAIQGVPVSIHSEESDPAWDCVIRVAGNNIYVTVTGIVATSIDWTGHVTATGV